MPNVTIFMICGGCGISLPEKYTKKTVRVYLTVLAL